MLRTRKSLGWGRWVEPWYLAYALLGATMAGLAPILLPLAVSGAGGAAQVGIVMGAFNIGGLTAPFWGTIADRYRRHRGLLTGGLLASGLGLAVFPFAQGSAAWVGPVLLLSVGTAGAATVANLFVVEAHPQAEWDERIGWLQTFYGGGRVGGLLLAGALSQIDLHVGLLAGALLMTLGGVTGWLTARTPPGPGGPRPLLRQAARHGECAPASPQCLFHYLRWETVLRLGMVLRSPFGLFQLVWLVAATGSTAVFILYPVLMQEVFRIDPGLSSDAFALALALGLFLYSPAGGWSDHFGAARVLRAALGVRLLALLGLLWVGIQAAGGAEWLALVAFSLVVLSWSLLAVSGIALAARLSPLGEGEALGIFNAVTAIAGVAGAIMGGLAAEWWGYNAASVLAVAGVGLSLALAWAIPPVKAGDGYIA